MIVWLSDFYDDKSDVLLKYHNKLLHHLCRSVSPKYTKLFDMFYVKQYGKMPHMSMCMCGRSIILVPIHLEE